MDGCIDGWTGGWMVDGVMNGEETIKGKERKGNYFSSEI